MRTLFTIGHSNRTFEEFLQVLQAYGVEALADVRSFPRSKFHPQFDRVQVSVALKRAGIAYVFLGEELGARRAERECYINGAVDYDLVKKTPAFLKGLDRVTSGLSRMSIALMCAERDPITCHRTILVASALKSKVAEIRHLISPTVVESHEEAERRLLSDYRSTGSDLFIAEDDLLRDAYRRRGKEIAYSEEQGR